MRARAVLLAAAVVLLPLFAAGCWDISDIRDQALVFGIGLDDAPGEQFVMTLQVPAPSGGGRDARMPMSARTISVTGTSVPESLSRAQGSFSQTLFLGHLRVLVLGEAFARHPVKCQQVLDYVLRSPLVDATGYLVVAHGLAQDILNAPTRPPPALLLNSQFDTVRRGLPAVPRTLWETLRDIETPGRELVVPGARYDPQVGLVVAGVAVFDRYRMVGWLTEDESIGLTWFFGSESNRVISVKTPAGMAGINIVESRTARRPHVEDGRPVMDVTVSVIGVIVSKPVHLPSITSKDFAVIQSQTEAEIERRMAVTLQALQTRFKVDAVGMGRCFYYRQSAVWKRLNWQEEFPRLSVHIAVKATLKRKGLLR